MKMATFNMDFGWIKEFAAPLVVIVVGASIGITVFNMLKPYLLQLKEKLYGKLDEKKEEQEKRKFELYCQMKEMEEKENGNN